MGSVKELMLEYWGQDETFKSIVLEVLSQAGFVWIDGNDPENSDPFDHVPYDVKVRYEGSETALVDFKIYRTSTLDLQLLWNAVYKISDVAAKENVQNVIVITNIEVHGFPETGIMNGRNFRVMGPSQLFALSYDIETSSKLYDALEEFREVTFAPPPRRKPEPQVVPSPPKHFDPDKAIELLQACPAGVGRPYEDACQYAIKGVFANDLNLWSGKQHDVEGGFHKIDLLAHINSRHDFWKGIRYDFRTRYIVFEFKNYAGPITQGEIYTTEKYLFAGALRMVAIMIARYEPPRLCRRPFGLSYAAMAGASSMV